LIFRVEDKSNEDFSRESSKSTDRMASSLDIIESSFGYSVIVSSLDSGVLIIVD
jgi:hypothetical protein